MCDGRMQRLAQARFVVPAFVEPADREPVLFSCAATGLGVAMFGLRHALLRSLVDTASKQWDGAVSLAVVAAVMRGFGCERPMIPNRAWLLGQVWIVR